MQKMVSFLLHELLVCVLGVSLVSLGEHGRRVYVYEIRYSIFGAIVKFFRTRNEQRRTKEKNERNIV